MTSTQDRLREQVSTARSRLGDTVEELAAKADVKHRAQLKAEDMRHRAQAAAGELRHRAQAATADLRDRAHSASDDLRHRVQEHTPEQARNAAGTAARGARNHPLPAGLAAALMLAVAYLLLRRGSHRDRR
ncbi:DUF3618 domain-containing protein [Streptomyces sp. NPDC051940]|uniref:DUF3618 domain-containing protein n=1 Tax=Streptomyces sp. NPDC051940 TaxID=3155675 RepID=UPI00341FAF1A